MKRKRIAAVIAAVLIVPVIAVVSVSSSADATTGYHSGPGEVIAAGTANQCLTLNDESESFTTQPCIDEPAQIFTAFSVHGVLYLVPSRNPAYCIAGRPAGGGRAVVYNCLAGGLSVPEGVYVTGVPGAPLNRIRNIKNQWLGSTDSSGSPVTWNKRGARGLDQGWVFKDQWTEHSTCSGHNCDAGWCCNK